MKHGCSHQNKGKPPLTRIPVKERCGGVSFFDGTLGGQILKEQRETPRGQVDAPAVLTEGRKGKHQVDAPRTDKHNNVRVSQNRGPLGTLIGFPLTPPNTGVRCQKMRRTHLWELNRSKSRRCLCVWFHVRFHVPLFSDPGGFFYRFPFRTIQNEMSDSKT